MIKERYYALEGDVPDVDEHLGNEMADVIAQVMRLADYYRIDLENAFIEAYLSSAKIASITEWFNPQCMDNFQPLRVHDFGNNTYTITDGHTRAYIAYKNGVSVLPVSYDNDDMIVNQVGQMQYRANIDWCKRLKLSHIKYLRNRILSKIQ